MTSNLLWTCSESPAPKEKPSLVKLVYCNMESPTKRNWPYCLVTIVSTWQKSKGDSLCRFFGEGVCNWRLQPVAYLITSLNVELLCSLNVDVEAA